LGEETVSKFEGLFSFVELDFTRERERDPDKITQDQATYGAVVEGLQGQLSNPEWKTERRKTKGILICTTRRKFLHSYPRAALKSPSQVLCIYAETLPPPHQIFIGKRLIKASPAMQKNHNRSVRMINIRR